MDLLFTVIKYIIGYSFGFMLVLGAVVWLYDLYKYGKSDHTKE